MFRFVKKFIVKFQEIQKLEDSFSFSDADRHYLKSLCCYYDGNLVETLSHLMQSLKSDPDHKKSKLMHTKLEKQQTRKNDGTFNIETFKYVPHFPRIASKISIKMCDFQVISYSHS